MQQKGFDTESNKGSQTNWWKQLIVLTQRSFINMCRDLGYYWLRIAVYIVLAISVGSIFFNIGRDHTNVMNTAACGGFMAGFMTFMSIGGFQSFIEEMKVKIYNTNSPSSSQKLSYVLAYFSINRCFLGKGSVDTMGLQYILCLISSPHYLS